MRTSVSLETAHALYLILPYLHAPPGTNSQEGTALAGYPASAMVAFAVDAKGRPIFSFSSISTHKQVSSGPVRLGVWRGCNSLVCFDRVAVRRALPLRSTPRC